MRPTTRIQSTQLGRFSDPRVTQSAYIEQSDRNNALYHAIWRRQSGGDGVDRVRGMRAVRAGRLVRRVGLVVPVTRLSRVTGSAGRTGWGGQGVRRCFSGWKSQTECPYRPRNRSSGHRELTRTALSWSYESELRLRALALELQDLRIRIDDDPVGLERAGDEDIPRLATVERDRRARLAVLGIGRAVPGEALAAGGRDLDRHPARPRVLDPRGQFPGGTLERLRRGRDTVLGDDHLV